MMYSHRRLALCCALYLSLAAAGCATAPTGEKATDAPSKRATGPGAHDNLNASLWVQTSPEYRALTRQTYAAARRRLDRALEDDDYSAALEQSGDYEQKPPAVVVDVDETVLDNSAYQASLITRDESFSVESWNAWCRKAKADAVPGALAFAEYADRQGVTVFYVTNREHEVEEATRSNLKELGFPMADDRDVLLTKYEREGWDGSKVPRRKLIARDFRILLLAGDSLGDFVEVPEGSSPKARRRIAGEHGNRWGRGWWMLPNPTYGDWEGSLYDYDYRESLRKKRRQKRDALTVPKELE